MIVRELELDLDAFEGPFDLLLTLILKEELDLADVDVAGIVVRFVERLAERDALDLDACGEFLVLVAALLELKARGLFEDEAAELSELEPEEAAEELARRLAEYRRMKEAAGWLSERLAGERDRFFRIGPAPLAPEPERRLAPQDPESLAGAPLPLEELVAAADDDRERVETALGLLSERYREGRSGIVLESVAGGWAFRASREAAEACGRLFERPVQRGLSQASLETLAIVAYLGPCSRPEIARIRGVAADSAVAGLMERGPITETGRGGGAGGAIKYRTTAMFERVFGLESLSQLPRLDDVAGDVDDLRERLHAVAGQRTA